MKGEYKKDHIINFYVLEENKSKMQWDFVDSTPEMTKNVNEMMKKVFVHKSDQEFDLDTYLLWL